MAPGRRAGVIAVLSPAKTLDFSGALPPLSPTRPRFAEEATALAGAAAKLSAPRLQALMAISPELATLNRDRFRSFAEAPARPALYAFAGDVYRGLDAASLDGDAVAYAQDHLRFLSGLYGLLRPLDAIRPYRLEMGTRWAPGRAKDLYGWWRDRVAAQLADDLAAEGSGVVLNLASQEYWRVVEPHLPAGVRVVTIDFRERRGGELRFLTAFGKRARGSAARLMAEERIATPEALKDHAIDGHRFDAAHSDGDRWMFVRG